MPAPSSPEQRSSSASREQMVVVVANKVDAVRMTVISQLLSPQRASGNAGRRRTLAFLETELLIIHVVLATFRPQASDVQANRWLHDFLFNLDLANDHVLREVLDPSSRHKLLRFRRRRKSYLLPSRMLLQLYHLAEHPCRYRHLNLTCHGLGLLTPLQLAEAKAETVGGAVPLVGIDRPAKKILRWLTHQGDIITDRPTAILRVMCIVGPVGIGKTALAMELRNRLRRRETSLGWRYSFHCDVMAQASQGTDRNFRLLQHIMSQVSPAATALSSDPSQANKTTMEGLVRLVSECLRDKRYLIIIDDIREASDWEEIKGAFPNTDNNAGSRILITTRYTSIADACCSGSYDGLVHKMKPLNDIDSQRLLLAKAVGSEDGCLPDNMMVFCDEMLRRCDGIPLFITCMADWLTKEQLLKPEQQRHQPRVDEDEKHQSFPIYCKQRLQPSLSSVFFNDFSNNELRLVLLYMSMFPYGYKFDKDRLILKWIFEGFVSSVEQETFFSHLVDRNVITRVATNCTHNNNVDGAAETRQWHANHFMQQFLASISAELGFVFTTTTVNILSSGAIRSRTPRRLAFHHPDPLLPSLLETMDLSQTRSLAVSGAVSGIPDLVKFVNLVVLDLEGWENLKDEDLVQLCRGNMLLLEYLSIRSTRVSRLPHEIKELQNLEALDVSHTQISELPLEVFELTALGHLDLRGTQISQVPKQIVGARDELVDLLVGAVTDSGTGEGIVTNSIKVGARVPHVVRHLYKLETLATVDLSQQPASFLRALGDLHTLRVLAVTWSYHLSTDTDYCEALRSSIGKWNYLKSLTIHCRLGCSMEFLGSLESSHGPRQLEKFRVTAGRFTSVPRWINGLCPLSFLQITICNKQTTTEDLKILGDLPSLQCLILGLDFIPLEAIVIGNEGFREIRRFSIDCPMPWLTFSTGAVPKLTYLQLKFCSTPASLACAPSGINNIHRLTEVALCYNAQYINSPSIKMTVDAVTKQLAEHGNPIDLFINGIEQDDVQEDDDEVTEITIGTSSRTNAGAEDDDAEAVGEEATAAVQCEITEAES